MTSYLCVYCDAEFEYVSDRDEHERTCCNHSAAVKERQRALDEVRDLLNDALTCDWCGESWEWNDNAQAYLCEDWDGCEGSCSPERLMERLQKVRRRLDELDDQG